MNGEGGPEAGDLGAGRSGWAGARTAALVGGLYAVCFLDSASLRVDAVGRLGKPVRDPGGAYP
jgi:hypothetical protein